MAADALIERALRRAGDLRIAIALAVSGALLLACDAPYEAPCRVSGRTEVISDPRIGPEGSSLHRDRDRVVASWQRREQLDAAADPTPVLVGFEVAVLDARGALLRRESVPTPPELRARKGGVEDVGVVVENGAMLVHWTETTSSTDPSDGRTRTAATLAAAYVRDGVVTPVLTSARATCERCTLRTAFAALGDGSVALVRITPDIVVPVLGQPPPAPSFVLLRISSTAATSAPVEVVEEVPWLVRAPPAPTPPPGGATPSAPVTWSPPEQPMSLRVDRTGRIVVTAEDRAWLLDPSLRPASGPLDFPSRDAQVVWSSASDAAIAWSLNPITEGRPASPTRAREIFVGLVPNGAAAIATRERVSHSDWVRAMDRTDGEVGIVFDTIEGRSFAAVDARGKKLGGDVVLRDRSSGFAFGFEQAVVVASDNGRFAAVSLGSGALVSTEIACAP